MPIYTTYLAFLRKADYNPLHIFPDALHETIIYYVMRNRGNNEVAPSEILLEWISIQKKNYGDNWSQIGKTKCWQKYVQEYLDQFNRYEPAKQWMKKVANEARRANVVLVCFEKDQHHCHRRLLAQEISQRFDVDYKGELTLKDIKSKGTK